MSSSRQISKQLLLMRGVLLCSKDLPISNMKKLHYLTYENVLMIHDTILRTFGGLAWVKNPWQLESVLHHIQNDEYYPTIIEKASHLFFWLIQFHTFNDGNKRTALLSLHTFFILNEIYLEDFVIKMEDIAIWVAKWEIKKEELIKIFRSMFLSFGYNVS